MPLKKLWNQFKNSPPGRRFMAFYEARQDERTRDAPWKRPLYVATGIVLSLGGVVLLGMPGPGLLVVALGLALIAGEFACMARLLDKAELLLRRWAEAARLSVKRMSPLQRAVCAALLILVVCTAGMALYLLLR